VEVEEQEIVVVSEEVTEEEMVSLEGPMVVQDVSRTLESYDDIDTYVFLNREDVGGTCRSAEYASLLSSYIERGGALEEIDEESEIHGYFTGSGLFTLEGFESDAFQDFLVTNFDRLNIETAQKFTNKIRWYAENDWSLTQVCEFDNRHFALFVQGELVWPIEWEYENDSDNFGYVIAYQPVTYVSYAGAGVRYDEALDAVMIITSYGDAGYVFWNAYLLDEDGHTSDLVESCSVSADDLLDEESGFTLSCSRELQM
jgi:hypothetical protein